MQGQERGATAKGTRSGVYGLHKLRKWYRGG